MDPSTSRSQTPRQTCVTQLFDVARVDAPVALLRAAGEATAAGADLADLP